MVVSKPTIYSGQVVISPDTKDNELRRIMGENIVIKGNRFGLNVQLPQAITFPALLAEFVRKLEEGRKFFGNSKISIKFEGRDLSQGETQYLVDSVHAHTDMEIFCIVDESMAVVAPEDFKSEPSEPEIIHEVVTKSVVPMESAVFHQGTVRSGQEINVATGIVIVGDVNPGAKVIAKGNIFVIGQLRGFAHAGFGGEEQACIFALKMAPTQIRIGRVIARSPDKFTEDGLIPQIAFLEDNRIMIDHIDRTFYNSFNLLK